MKLGISNVSTIVAACGLISSLLAGGCAIHSQAPIREVAYDFSDARFYDRAYAPSPAYFDGQTRPSQEVPVARAERPSPDRTPSGASPAEPGARP